MASTSRESQAIIDYLKATGLPHRVTDVNTPKVHTATSWHYAPGAGGIGTAVDFGGSVPGVTPQTIGEMAAIWRAFRPVAAQLAELFYQGPDITMVVKNGAWRSGLSTLGKDIWNAHKNHVHVAVRPGTFLVPPRPISPTAAGSGPPTVTSRQYPEGENMLTRHDVNIPALDGQGRGWVELDVDPDKVVSVGVNGPYPPVDNYWEIPVCSWQNRGGKTIITLTEGQPNAPILVRVWTVG